MTNKEIAKMLNISPAALSLIINHKPGVSDETRKRVLSKLNEMGLGHLIKQVPSASVNNSLCFLIYKRHGEILDVHPFFLLLLESIETRARDYGYNVMICTIDKRKPMEPQFEHLKNLNTKGIIIFATEMEDEDLEMFFQLSVPVVSLDNDFTRLSINTVAINNQMGTYQAVEHLVQNGHRRIGYFKSKARISSFRERESGYKAALNHFGLFFLPEDIIDIHFTEEGAYRDMKNYLMSHAVMDLPEAFVCDDDTSVVGAMRAFAESGIRVPDDISIVGYNDRPSCELTIPPLTTINVSKFGLTANAVDELMKMIEHGETIVSEERSRKVRIGTNLVVRESVKNKMPK